MTEIKLKAIEPAPSAVFLDFGDTLVGTEPLYIERLRQSFENIGVIKTYEEMEKAYLDADWRSAVALLKREPFPQDAWQGMFAAIMGESLGLGHNAKELMTLLAREMTRIKPVRRLIEGVENFLKFSKERNIRMAVLSNNDGRTREKCRSVGIEDYFEEVLDSTLEKITKPNPAFFINALERMKLEPEEVLHVGDLLGCDVMGAQKAGIAAALFQIRDYKPEVDGVNPDYTVNSFSQVCELLAGAGN